MICFRSQNQLKITFISKTSYFFFITYYWGILRLVEFQKWYSKENGSKYELFSFFIKYKEIMEKYLQKNLQWTPLMKKGIILEKLRATEIIWCPTRLLKASNVNTDYFIFSSLPVNMPSYSTQKYTFVFIQRKKNKTKQ